METLAKLFTATPNTEEINLQHCQLHSLDPLLPLLKQFQELRHLNISQNGLSSLPLEMGQLTRLVALDISNNPFPSLQQVIPVLQTLPALKSLSVSFVLPTDQDYVLKALPKLRILNAAPLPFTRLSTPSRLPDMAKPIGSLLPAVRDHVQNVSSILSVLKSIGNPVEPHSEEDLRITRMFEHQVELAGMTLKQDGSVSPEQQTAALLQAKFKILTATTTLATQKAGECNPELGLAIQTLIYLHHELITSYHALTQSLLDQAPKDVEPAQLKQLLEVAEGLETDLQESTTALAIEKKKSASLQEENLRLRHQLGDNRPRSPMLYGTESKAARVHPPPPPPPVVAQKQQTKRPPQLPLVLVKKDKSIRDNNAPRVAPKQDNLSELKPVAMSSPVPNAVKNLTLKQLRDMIQAIYVSKRKADEMAIENRAAKETMEQHMYTYLNQRFGLHSLIVEYASAIMKGCTRFMKMDADVATFFHVIRNEVDEGFLRLKNKLEETVVALLRAFLRGLHPRKSEAAVNQMVNSKLSDQTYLTEEEWHSVVKYMYDTHDSHSIIRLVETHLSQDEPSNDANTLPFSSFRKILLSYQMHGRLRMLDDFCRYFEQVDTEKVGIITQQSLVDLMLRYTPYKTQDEMESIVQQADPLGNDAITFSEAVEVLFKDIRSHRVQQGVHGGP
ncbi:hypothetical protein THRCLA_05685 [Thraustotheca clavata]|uniref:Uncharacterized protein n=1 Tax=Thraustotheca clavata TaxID=74557 RepID=A0A1V9ZV20_9STRA|nr:hypothetical protein THRCLA_05685 [Thraustotheca clavata]